MLADHCEPASDRIIDSLPVMLAKGGHAYSANVARDVAGRGYCASKRVTFTAFVCKQSRTDGVEACHFPSTSGSEKVRSLM